MLRHLNIHFSFEKFFRLCSCTRLTSNSCINVICIVAFIRSTYDGAPILCFIFVFQCLIPRKRFFHLCEETWNSSIWESFKEMTIPSFADIEVIRRTIFNALSVASSCWLFMAKKSSPKPQQSSTNARSHRSCSHRSVNISIWSIFCFASNAHTMFLSSHSCS